MKKAIFILLVLCLLAPLALARGGGRGGYVSVGSYATSRGIFVPSYVRSAPDQTVTNNWTYKGNTNPVTGAVGTNKYTSSKSSLYYRGY
jgi:hypothetical protein